MGNRTTTHSLPGDNTDAFAISTGIPQSSPLLTNLFLFYNANLVNVCNLSTLPTSGISFVDDVNALALVEQLMITVEHCKVSMSAAWSGQ
jgi:hypothetical protein